MSAFIPVVKKEFQSTKKKDNLEVEREKSLNPYEKRRIKRLKNLKKSKKSQV